MKSVIKAIALSSVVLTTGCASMFTQDAHQVNVLTSNGQEVSGNIEGVPFTAPGVVSVRKSDHDQIVVTETENCSKQTILHRSIEPTFWVNIFGVGAFGSTTDYANNKMWKYEDSVMINCKG